MSSGSANRYWVQAERPERDLHDMLLRPEPGSLSITNCTVEKEIVLMGDFSVLHVHVHLTLRLIMTQKRLDFGTIPKLTCFYCLLKYLTNMYL